MRSTHADDVVDVPEGNRWVSMQGLIHQASPYITLDDSRMSAFSPSAKATFPTDITSSKAAAVAAARRKSRLPNTTLNIDLRTLNLHLALRTAEILACAESMWEWVVEYQAQVEAQKRENAAQAIRRARSGSNEYRQPRGSQSTAYPAVSGSASDLHKNAILELTREDFDGLLSKFEMCVPHPPCSCLPLIHDRL